jgi:hypothetical protein
MCLNSTESKPLLNRLHVLPFVLPDVIRGSDFVFGGNEGYRQQFQSFSLLSSDCYGESKYSSLC